MQDARRSIYRKNALKDHLDEDEQKHSLRFVHWSMTTCLWFLLMLFLVTGFLSWCETIPVYANVAGIVLDHKMSIQEKTARASQPSTIAALFLLPNQTKQLHLGQNIPVQVGLTGAKLQSTIEQIEPGVASPADIRKRYASDSIYFPQITEPSTVVLIKLVKTPTSTQAGSPVIATIEVGSERLITMLSGIGS
jgi:hypothetical protein